MLDKMTVLTSLLFLLRFGITLSAVLDLHKRIIGGQDCGPQQHDYHVKLIGYDGELVCGGSLISEWWILTSAHCWIWGLKVIVGVHPGPGQLMIIQEPPQIYEENNIYHDIMLLKLPKRAVRRTIGIPPLGCTNPGVGAILETAGLAAMTTAPQFRRERNEAITLQCGQITVNGHQYMTQVGDTKYQAHTLTADSNPVDVSQGDSGGGVEYQGAIYALNTAINDTVTAFSGKSFFLDVCTYRDWINNTMIHF
uniref:Kallikrein-8-like n=1 Tax=Takifugu rubripes TaxID=31033 RepID=A0A674N601_TAKRU